MVRMQIVFITIDFYFDTIFICFYILYSFGPLFLMLHNKQKPKCDIIRQNDKPICNGFTICQFLTQNMRDDPKYTNKTAQNKITDLLRFSMNPRQVNIELTTSSAEVLEELMHITEFYNCLYAHYMYFKFYSSVSQATFILLEIYMNG